nr:thiol-disulfide oxidoreductase ResA [Priestia megaterium]MDH3188975.1 thiol-disulfide oxidoreductase ResA [Priestia megaterium]MDH3188986.1 thiol-disulfide oxidoreductase ResA [Priestia megaterium]
MKINKRQVFRITILSILLLATTYTVYTSTIKKEDAPSFSSNSEAPDFALKTLDNKEVQLSNLRGKGVIINFWGSWCKPCEKEMPALESTYKEYKNKNVEIIGVNLEESNIVVKTYVDRKDLSFPILLDKDGQVRDIYNVSTIPSSFFINEEGKIVKEYVGQMSEETLNKWATELSK